ncbi:MAG: hypothetical protein LBC86_00065 [Oscillospiraceae bacterium]|jgi:HPt (histidine-containing phosphotransfer) domain-containing protein|nr:hypothetical protein [Oscillospiraceae bacterium]
MNEEMILAITQDIKKALLVLESVMNSGIANTGLFTTTVHGMKSALANIGEAELSSAAFKLEKAGKSDDINFITAETPGFISALKEITEKYKKEENYAIEVSGEALIFLREKFDEIGRACEAYNKRAVKEILAELRKQAWTREITDVLDEISLCLLHGEFKKIVLTVKEFSG